MEHGYDDDPIFLDDVEERVRKSVKEDSADLPVDHLKRQRSLLRQGDGGIDGGYEVIAELR
jgi:hypothetical protein